MKGQYFYCTSFGCMRNRWYILLNTKNCGELGYRHELYCHECHRIIIVYTKEENG